MTDKQKLPANTDKSIDSVAEELDPILKELPAEQRELFVSLLSIQSSRSPESEVAKKITSDHITKLLDNQSKSMDYTHQDEVQRKIYSFGVIVVAVVLIIVLVVLLKDNPDLLEKIISHLITLIGGALAGYGIAKTKYNGQ